MKTSKPKQIQHFVYILRCADGSLYCGSTNNLEKRLHQHNFAKAGAKYTRGRRPVVLKYSEKVRTFAQARAREAELKRLTRPEKLLFLKSLTRKSKVIS